MTLLAWIVLLLIAAAVAAATVMRTRPAARISEAQRLRVPPVPRDDLAGLGLSAPRPAAPRADGPRPIEEPAARPATETVARPVAQPVEAGAARPVAVPASATPSAWIGDVLDGPDDAERLDAEPLDAEPLDAERLDPADLDAPEAPRLVPSPEDVEDTLLGDEPDAAPAYDPEPDEALDDSTVWTFDHAAADTAEPAAAPPAYVRAGQALWPEGDAAVALLAASLAARLGGTVAVLRHDGQDYLVELLAGDAAAALPAGAAPEALAAAGHPLHRVPQDGVLSLLGPGAALPYHDAPRQTLVQTLAEAPHARVLLVADVLPGAPDVDGTTAALVSGYADLLAGLTRAPLAPDGGIAWPPDAPDLPDLPDAAPADEMTDAETTDTSEPDADASEASDAPGMALDAFEALGESPDAVARPGTRRAAPRTSRGIILTGEIDAARRDRRLLVFALVTLADAEAVVRAGDAGVVRAEAALRQRLTAARAVRRVEPFGSLLFGVFLDAEGPEVVQWAERISAQGHPLLVGAVPAVGSEESVRGAATEALQSAYEREVVCVVAA